MVKITLSTLALAMSLTLAGCGGGGSSSTAPAPVVAATCPNGGTNYPTCTAPVAPSCTNGATNYPTCTVPVTPSCTNGATNYPTCTVPRSVQAATLQAAVAPTYPAASQEYAYFTAANAFRSSQGLGPLNQDPHYDAAAAAHVAYIVANGSSSYGHGETPGLVGYTGTTPFSRVQYQFGVTGVVAEAQDSCNYPVQTTAQCFAALVEEEGAASDAVNAGAESAAGLIDTVFHRASLMYQGVTSMGVSVGIYTFSDMGFISHAVDQNNLAISTQVNAGNYFAVYPTDGQTGIGTIAMLESPTPYPASVTTPAYPISVASENSTTLNVISFTVTQAGSTTPLASLLLAGGTVVTNNLAFLIATTPFLPNTVYTVNFVGTITGTATGSATGIPMNKSWSFTTGAANCGAGYDVLC